MSGTEKLPWSSSIDQQFCSKWSIDLKWSIGQEFCSKSHLSHLHGVRNPSLSSCFTTEVFRDRVTKDWWWIEVFLPAFVQAKALVKRGFRASGYLCLDSNKQKYKSQEKTPCPASFWSPGSGFELLRLGLALSPRRPSPDCINCVSLEAALWWQDNCVRGLMWRLEVYLCLWEAVVPILALPKISLGHQLVPLLHVQVLVPNLKKRESHLWSAAIPKAKLRLTFTNSESTLEPGGFFGSKANVIPLTW